MLNFIFFGATKFSKTLLDSLIKNNLIPKAIFGIPRNFYIKYRNESEYRRMTNYTYADLKKIANSVNCPYYEVDGSTGKKLIDYKEIIKQLAPDLILVLGWYYLVPKDIRDLARFGAWGIHASLLPKYAGGAPLVWAIINGEEKAGVTLFKLDEGVDDGNIIAQKAFQIKFTDTIKTVYSKAIIASQEILLSTLKNIDKVIFIPQKKSKVEIFPQRFPEDGEINWNKSAIEIYNFIRAQTLPYPCAFSNINGMQIRFIDAKIIKNNSKYFPNGMIVNINNKACIATNDKFLQTGGILHEGKRYKFTDFTRTYNLWGGYSRARILELAA